MAQRLAIIGFIIAVIVAIAAFSQRQQAVQLADTASIAQAQAESRELTSVAQAAEAAAGRAQAEEGQAAAIQSADEAATDVADAQGTADAAVAQAEIASTSQAAGEATAGAQAAGAIATATAVRFGVERELGDIQDDLATAQALVAADETDEAAFQAALATATAQVDLANFALQAAEEDRATALASSRGSSTQVAALQIELATAQFQLTGLPPAPTADAPVITIPPPVEATEIVEETPVVEATLDTDLTATFTSQNGVISFNYPVNWVAGQTDSGFIAIFSSEDVLTREQAALTEGQFEASLYVLSGSQITNTTEPPLADVATALRQTFTGDADSTFDLGEVENLQVGDRAAAIMTGTAAGNDSLLLIVELGDDAFALVIASMPVGDLDFYTPIIIAMMETLQF